MKKKVLFILALLLIPFTVFAKNVEYEWGKQKERGLFFVEEQDNKYVIYEPGSSSDRFVTYETNGKKVSSRELTDVEYDIIDDTLYNLGSTKWYYYDSSNYYEFNPSQGIIKEWNNDTNQYDTYNYAELSEADQKKYTGDYHLLFELYKNGSTDVYLYHIKKGGYVLYRMVPPANVNEEAKVYVEVYNKDEEKVLSKKMDSLDDIKIADITGKGIYVVEVEYDHDKKEAKYSYVEYDFSGKETSRQDITKELLEYGTLDEEYLYYVRPIILDSVSDGIIISLEENNMTESYQDCLTGKSQNLAEFCRAQVLSAMLPSNPIFPPAEQEILVQQEGKRVIVQKDNTLNYTTAAGLIRRIPTILVKLKFDVDYEIIPKVQGEGEIKVIDRSAAGGEVTFEVTPKEGYVLSVVKVTDAAGNVITFTDYTFTMPSSDVTIEAVFVPGNPNTTDIAIMGVVIVGILFGAIAVINYKKFKRIR